MDLDKIPAWILDLEPEDAGFLKNFVLKSGSLKEIAKLYSVSYPTVRLLLDKLIKKIELSDQKTAKLILDRYQQEEHRRPSNITPLKQDRR